MHNSRTILTNYLHNLYTRRNARRVNMKSGFIHNQDAMASDWAVLVKVKLQILTWHISRREISFVKAIDGDGRLACLEWLEKKRGLVEFQRALVIWYLRSYGDDGTIRRGLERRRTEEREVKEQGSGRRYWWFPLKRIWYAIVAGPEWYKRNITKNQLDVSPASALTAG